MADADFTSDLVVIGGGFGGLTAALRATELGLSATLLEKGSGEQYPCNSRYSGGIVHVSFRNIRRPPEELTAAVIETTAGEADPVQTKALVENISRWVDWLQQHGASFMRFNMEEAYSWCMAPPRELVPGPDWDGRGPDRLLQSLMQQFTAAGGRALLGTRATELVMEGGVSRGVIAEQDGRPLRLEAAAVLIADGGFQAHRDSFVEFIGPRFEAVFQRGAATGMGDGMRMAERAGARLTDRSPFYGHLLARGVQHNEKLWPYPELDAFATAGVIVGPDGRRFLDEGTGGIAVANALAGSADPGSAVAIFDAAIWEGPGRAHRIPANPLLEQAGATIYRAETIEELAAQLGLPAAAVAGSVARHNQAFDSNGFAALDPPRLGTKAAPHPIRTPTYMAIGLVPGITYTMGGIAVDGAARVLDQAGAPIPGLFAAGSSTGGLEGGSRKAYVGGISKAGVFGMLAAEEAARTIRKVELDVSVAKRGSDYPMLDIIVRHGNLAALFAGPLVALALIVLLWPVIGWLAAPAGALAGGIVYVTLRSITELITLILKMLAPQ